MTYIVFGWVIGNIVFAVMYNKWISKMPFVRRNIIWWDNYINMGKTESSRNRRDVLYSISILVTDGGILLMAILVLTPLLCKVS